MIEYFVTVSAHDLRLYTSVDRFLGIDVILTVLETPYSFCFENWPAL